MDFSIPHAYSGPHAYWFCEQCPPHMLIWDHTAIRATRVYGFSEPLGIDLEGLDMEIILLKKGLFV